MDTPSSTSDRPPSLRRGLRISLRWKVAAAVTVLLGGMAVVIALALVRYERGFLLQEGENRVRALVQALAVSARDPLLAGDELALGPLVESIMEDPDAAYVYVLDHEGRVAYHPDTQRIGEPAPADDNPEGLRLLEAQAPVIVEGTLVGTARVGLSAAFVDRAARATARGLLVRLGLGTLLGLAGVLLLTELHVRRIERLEGAVDQLARGDLGAAAEVRGRDELARLAGGFNGMVAELRAARREIERGVTETVSALACTLEVNDPYTRGHCERVARATRAVAERLGVAGDRLRDAELAAVLHDIGKVGVRTEVLTKRSRLTESEAAEMRQHAELGARILESVSFLEPVARYVRYHHEDWDGSGYPEGLAGEAIPLAARIIHVVDAYDAMTSSRPYRRALAHEEAMRRIVADRGRQFDPRVVDVAVELAAEGALQAIRREVDGGLAA
ncbi:MAG: HD domain-containing phosphohydrolase [Thermoanaerobaculia bacterium]|nr:HD domain-containing phosphohydrolase [Thermoanaerobaculia bacterium]